jgi:chromosomal replication initiation ATPase DnaA
MFVKLFGDRQVAVDPRVITYLVARMERSPEEAVALAEAADRLALARGTAITRRIAAAALAERGVAQLELDLEGDDDE